MFFRTERREITPRNYASISASRIYFRSDISTAQYAPRLMPIRSASVRPSIDIATTHARCEVSNARRGVACRAYKATARRLSSRLFSSRPAVEKLRLPRRRPRLPQSHPPRQVRPRRLLRGFLRAERIDRHRPPAPAPPVSAPSASDGRRSGIGRKMTAFVRGGRDRRTDQRRRGWAPRRTQRWRCVLPQPATQCPPPRSWEDAWP
jgi:hypothetical protein